MSEFAERCVKKAMEWYPSADESEIFERLGASTMRLGFTVDRADKSEFVLMRAKPGRAVGAFRDFDDPRAGIDRDAARNAGASIWNELGKKAKSKICSTEVKQYLQSGNLEKALEKIVEIVVALTALGAVFLPLVEEVVVSVLMLLLKIGINSYCDWEAPK